MAVEKLFFKVSKAVGQRLTDTFDFVWPTATAIWNLRWQVQGFVSVNPQANEEELAGRFVAGSGIRGCNLRHACMAITWEAQQQQFAKFLLIECCALYEAWCEGVVDELGCRDDLLKHLQFPSESKGGKTSGLTYAIGIINSSLSQPLNAAIYPSLLKNKKNCLNQVENLLLCYRFFKECRNAVIHRGGIASQKTEDLCKEYKKLTASSLKAKEVPDHRTVTKDQPIQLSLRGVVGFGDIILKLIATLDAEFSKFKLAEHIFIDRWKARYNRKLPTLAGNFHRRHDQILIAVRGLDLPTPQSPAALEPFLRQNRLVFSMSR